jgi:hypothetical protein
MENTDVTKSTAMKWFHYIAVFISGLFLANVVPHYINGVSGNPFPSPFANPPGKGLSSPLTNVLWALANLLVGYLLFRFSKTNSKTKLALIIFFAAIVCMSIMLASTFGDRVK